MAKRPQDDLFESSTMSFGEHLEELRTTLVRALIGQGVIDKAPTSKKALASVQEAFNHWHEESGRSFSEISRTLSATI